MATNKYSREQQLGLKRSIGPVLLTLYGVGTILGAGIYVLLGDIARLAGAAMPLAFVIAGVIASFSALSYAELGSRLPRSAGEAAYVDEAFGVRRLASLTGWGVILTGIVSAATLSRGFVGYLAVFVDFQPSLVITLIVLGLTGLAAWGIGASLRVAGLVTIVEAIGLIAVCFIARSSLEAPAERWLEMLPSADLSIWAGILAGAFVAFYAFIGFEDMVNVVEEVIAPERVLPGSIIVALVLSSLLYVVVAVTASLALPLDVLANSDAPMAVIVTAYGYSPSLIALIGLFAVINGALIQLVMASRVLYGMGSQGLVWHGFAYVHPGRRTPLAAVVFAGTAIAIFALLLPLSGLAQLTSFIALIVFTTVNVSLLVIKRTQPRGAFFMAPKFVPVLGALLCGGMLAARVWAFVAAGLS